jgi:hypothetical protein
VVPVWKNAGFVNQEFSGYDVLDDAGRKILSINTPKQMNIAQLEYALGTELLKSPRKAVLVKDMAFLKRGALVSILQVDSNRKKAKFAALDGRVRGWASLDNFLIKEAKFDSKPHDGHMDNVLGVRETEYLIQCPVEGIKWVNKEQATIPTKDVSITPPLATPESLNLEEAKIKHCPKCDDAEMYEQEGHWHCPSCQWILPVKEASKKIAKVILKKDDKLVKEFNTHNEALMWLHNQVDYSWDEAVKHQGWKIEEVPEKEAASPQVLTYPLVMDMTKEQLMALPTISQGHTDNLKFDDGKHRVWVSRMTREDGAKEDNEIIFEVLRGGNWVQASLDKQARVVERSDGWHVLSEEGKNLGGPYTSKEKAVKRLRQVEFFKHKKGSKALSKKEAEQEVATEPTLSLEDHIGLMRERMSTCIERLNTPATKTASEEPKIEEKLEVKEDPKVLVEDIQLAIDMLETIYKDSPKAHDKLEELENLLYSLEQTVGLPLDLPAEEAKEPEHKEFVEEKKEASAEDDMEIKFERAADRLDKRFMNHEISQEQYDSEMAALKKEMFPKEASAEKEADDVNRPPTQVLPPGQKWMWNQPTMKWVVTTVQM